MSEHSKKAVADESCSVPLGRFLSSLPVAAAAICAIAYGACAGAGNIALEGGGVATVSGDVQVDDVSTLEKMDIKTIVFAESLGGTMEAVRAYVELIKRRKLNTVVKGRCYSACAVSFLAGSTRSVFPKANNMIMLHVARVVDKESGVLRPSNQNHKLLALIDELTDGKMRDPVRSKIANSWTEASGVAFLIGPGWWGERQNTVYCDGSQGKDTSKCQLLFNADPYDLGILTKPAAKAERNQ